MLVWVGQSCPTPLTLILTLLFRLTNAESSDKRRLQQKFKCLLILREFPHTPHSIRARPGCVMAIGFTQPLAS